MPPELQTPPPQPDAAAHRSEAAPRWTERLHGLGPVIGLVLLCIAGTLLNSDFATPDNALNVLTRTSFIGIIAVGMCFVIISGGIDLSVGSMAALIAGSVIMFINWAGPALGSPMLAVVAGAALAVVLGAMFGLAHGLLITKGRIEPFIVTLGTLGIFRAYLTYFADGGALTLDNDLADLYAPVYYASLLGIPVPVLVFVVVAVIGGVILNRTAYGRYVQAIGSNEQVARYAAVDVDRVKILTYVLLGVCGHRHAAVCAAPGLCVPHHRPAVGAGSHRRRDCWRHRFEGRRGQYHRHCHRRHPALGHQQHPEPHQHHQCVPQRCGAGLRHHRRRVPAARAPLVFPVPVPSTTRRHFT